MIDHVAQAVRRERVARGLTLSELARVTGIAKATLSAIEHAQANPRLDTLTALAGALGVGVAELVGPPPLAPVRLARRGDAPASLRVPGAGARHVELGPRVVEELPVATGRRLLFVAAGTLVAGPPERPSELGEGDLMACPPGTALQLRTERRAASVLVVTLADEGVR